jgi:hypothetical protein
MSSAGLRVLPTSLGLLVACLAVVALGACAAGRNRSANNPVRSASEGPTRPASDTVARVGQLVIARPMLNHWMEIEFRDDYESVFKRNAPEDPVSEPPNYPACIAVLQRLVPFRGTGRRNPPASSTQLRDNCKQLYRAIKTQALSFLVASDWLINFGSAHGVNVTEEEVSHTLKRVEAEQRTMPGQSAESRVQALGKAVYLAKIDLLRKRLAQRIQREGGGDAKLAKEASGSANTAVCPTGYVVVHCLHFKAPAYTGPSPSVLLRAVARMVNKK